jgi:hypothetical protein
MRRSLLFSLAAVAAMSALADTSDGRFEPGMVWETTLFTTSDPPHDIHLKYYIDGETVVNDRQVQQLWRQDTDDPESAPQLATVIYQEEGRVWFHAKRNSDLWQLLYDFNLSEGEMVEVGTVPYDYGISDNPQIFNRQLKCLKRETDDDGLVYLTMQELHEGDESENIAEDELNVWIKGIGSTSGVLWNYGNSLDGVRSRLNAATLGSVTLYPAGPSGVERVERVENGTPMITGRYHIDGTKASQLDRGIIIVTYSDGTVRKSVVR